MSTTAQTRSWIAVGLISLSVWSSILAGCGGSSSSSPTSSSTTSDTGQALGSAVPTSSMRGRLKLDVPVRGATVTVLDSTTRSPVSLPAVSGPGGFFVVDVPKSGAFTLVATAPLNGATEVYGRSYDKAPPSRFLHINAITSVAARYHERHPSMHAADAERAVKRLLGVPLALDAGAFGHAHGTTRFSHTTFLRAARAYSGGEPAYLDALATQVDAPGAKSGRKAALATGPLPDLSTLFSTLQSRWSSLWTKQQQPAYSVTESDLQEVEQSESAFTDASSVVSNDLYNDGIESSSVVASTASADVAEDVASGVAAQSLRTLAVEGFVKGAAGAVGGICIQALFSAIFPTANPEAEVLQALQAISGQLTRIQSSVTQLQAYVSSAFAQSEYYTNAESLRGAFTTIDTAWNGPDSSGRGGYAGTLSQAAQGSSSAAASALADILPGGQNYQSVATLSNAQSQIASAQIASTPGAPSLMQQFRDLVSPTVNGYSYRYASNLTINQMYGQFNQLAAYQMKAAQVIACLQRAGSLTSAPDFDGARATIKATTDQIQQQRSMLPFPMTDDKMIYDTSSGLVLYGEIFAPTSVNQLNFSQRAGGWRYLNGYVNPYTSVPWPDGNVAPISFSAGDLSTTTNNTLFLPTPGLLWTFLDKDEQTYSGLDAYSRQPDTSPVVPYLQVLEQYGLSIDSPQPWRFTANYLKCNYNMTPGNLQLEYQGTGNPNFSTVITTGYYTPWNEISLLNASAWPFQDRFNQGSPAGTPRGAVFDPNNQGFFSVVTADNNTVAPYVLMAYAGPGVQPSPLPPPVTHPDLNGSLLPNTVRLCNVARVPVVDASGNSRGGLHCATNRALFGCGSQQAAAVAFGGTQIVAMGAENPQPNPAGLFKPDRLFGLTGVPAGSLPDFINQYYGGNPLSEYVEGPNGIDNDIDTCYGPGDTLINTCWDLTPYMYWTSSNPAVADVSNAPGQIGRILRVGGAQAGTVTFTGTRVELNRTGAIGNRTGAIGTAVTVTCQYTFPAVPAAALQTIFITPRYQTLHVVAQPQQTKLFAVGGYSDGTSQTLSHSSNGLTWSSSDPNVQVAFDGTVVVTGTPTNQTVTITATSGSVSSTVDINVLNP